MSTIGVGRAFRNQDREGRARNERRLQTVDRIRERGVGGTGLAPESLEAAEREEREAFARLTASTRRWALVFVPSVLLYVGLNGTLVAWSALTPGTPSDMGELLCLLSFGPPVLVWAIAQRRTAVFLCDNDPVEHRRNGHRRWLRFVRLLVVVSGVMLGVSAGLVEMALLGVVLPH